MEDVEFDKKIELNGVKCGSYDEMSHSENEHDALSNTQTSPLTVARDDITSQTFTPLNTFVRMSNEYLSTTSAMPYWKSVH